MTKIFPVIDPVATGANILRLRKAKGLSVRDVQNWFGFEEPQAIYKWQKGQSLPSVDNLFALGALLEVSIEEILVARCPSTITNGGINASASFFHNPLPNCPLQHPRDRFNWNWGGRKTADPGKDQPLFYQRIFMGGSIFGVGWDLDIFPLASIALA